MDKKKMTMTVGAGVLVALAIMGYTDSLDLLLALFQLLTLQ